MKIEKIMPKTVTYALSMEKQDDDRWMCSWANFILDYDSWRLTINSDAGDYTYCWGNNRNDNFTDLMARVEKGYLLNKMSNRSEFLIDDSKKETIRAIEENGWEEYGFKSRGQWEDVKMDINNIDSLASEEMFYREVDNMVPDIDFESIYTIKDYPKMAKVAVEIFIKYIQPILKEDLAQ